MTQINKTMLTAEFCRQNWVVFRPKTTDEALFIQQRLADFGIRWVDGGAVGARVLDCVAGGMTVQGGNLYHSPGDDARNILCTLDQFDKGYVPPEQQLMVELFNKLTAKVDALSEKVDRLYAELHPDIADTKPGLGKKPRSPGDAP